MLFFEMFKNLHIWTILSSCLMMFRMLQ